MDRPLAAGFGFSSAAAFFVASTGSGFRTADSCGPPGEFPVGTIADDDTGSPPAAMNRVAEAIAPPPMNSIATKHANHRLFPVIVLLR